MTGLLTTTALVSVDISLRVRKMTQSTFFSQSRVCSMAYGSLMQVFGGAYWSRTLYDKYPNDAYLLLAAGSLISEHSERSIGMAVRPVITP